MKRYNVLTHEREEKENVDKFLKEIRAVCIKNRMSIIHEDSHGGFIVTKYNKDDMDWLLMAAIKNV